MDRHEYALKEIGNALKALPETEIVARRALSGAALHLSKKYDLPGPAMSVAMKARDPAMLRKVFKTWPEEPWTQIHRKHRGEKIGTLIHEKHFDMLRACHDAGIHFQSSFNLLVDTALERDDPDYIDFLRKDFSDLRPIWKPQDFAFHADTCGPGLAGYFYHDLMHYLENPHSAAVRSFVAFRLAYMPLKPLAVLLATGKDITSIYSSQVHSVHPHLANLIAMTGSNHGQLALKAMEPDVLDVIGRDNAGVFYGMDARTYAEDFPETKTST